MKAWIFGIALVAATTGSTVNAQGTCLIGPVQGTEQLRAGAGAEAAEAVKDGLRTAEYTVDLLDADGGCSDEACVQERLTAQSADFVVYVAVWARADETQVSEVTVTLRTVAGVDFSHRAAVNGDVTTAARQALAGALSNLLGGRRAEVRVRSIPPGASITIDGNEAGEAPVITELDIGSHSFRATLEGHRPANERVDIAEDQDVELRLEPYPVEPVPSSSAGMRIAGFSLLGAGAVGLSLTLALTLSDLGCQDSRPNGCFDDREIAAGPFALWMGLSSAAMITGLVLVLAAPKRNASVSLRPTGADFRMRF